MNEIFSCKRDDGPGCSFTLRIAHDADDNLFVEVESGGVGAGIVLTSAQTRQALVHLREFGIKTGILIAGARGDTDPGKAEPADKQPVEGWDCGNHRLHATAALSIIAQNQATNWTPEAIQAIDELCTEAGPEACRDLVADRLPF